MCWSRHIRWGYSQLRHSVPHTMFFFGFGLSLAGRYDNPMPWSSLSPSMVLWIWQLNPTLHTSHGQRPKNFCVESGQNWIPVPAADAEWCPEPKPDATWPTDGPIPYKTREWGYMLPLMMFPMHMPGDGHSRKQCCGSGIRCLLDPGSGIGFSGSRIPSPYFR